MVSLLYAKQPKFWLFMLTHDNQNRAKTAPEDSVDSAGPASPEQHILQYRAEAAPHLRRDCGEIPCKDSPPFCGSLRRVSHVSTVE